MRRSLVELHVHLVWATWDRLACLDPGICERVHAAIAAKATALGCQRVTVGGVADHVHVLLTLPATLAVADLVKHLKGNSSHFINATGAMPGLFRWQGSYAALSVSSADRATVQAYLVNQAVHHQQGDVDLELEQVSDPNDEPKPHGGGAPQDQARF